MSGLSVSEAEVTPLDRVDQPPTLSKRMDGVILSNRFAGQKVSRLDL